MQHVTYKISNAIFRLLESRKTLLISDIKDLCIYKSTVGSALELTHVKQIKGHHGGG